MKSKYIAASHSFQEQPEKEERPSSHGTPEQISYETNLYNEYLSTLRIIPCRPGDKWQEGVLYEEGKDYKIETIPVLKRLPVEIDGTDLARKRTAFIVPVTPSTEQTELWKEPFQIRVHEWMLACFGPEIAYDKKERNHRFLEEAIELVQAKGCTKEDAIMLVDYVFSRPIGEINQEIGGVMVTLAALCNVEANNIQLAGETELKRIWSKIDKIREKQKNKPRNSPLPMSGHSITRKQEVPEAVEFGKWLREQRADIFYGSPTTADLYKEFQLYKKQKP